jgi:hypothetical protein
MEQKGSRIQNFNRETGIRSFMPKQLECIYTNEILGLVLCNGNCYYTSTTIENDFFTYHCNRISLSRANYINRF